VYTKHRTRWGFIAAWVFLVVVVAIGFYLQSLTIQRIEDDEKRFKEVVMNQQQQLCGILLTITDEAVHPEVREAFHEFDVICPKS
jgi:hypothetical protein